MFRRLLISFVSCLTVAGLFVGVPIVNAQGDCDDNAIVRCGASSITELRSKMTGDIPAIFAHYGVTSSNLGNTVVGTVRRDGTVLVNGQTVATGAISVGRQNMAGSSLVSGLNVYERPTSVSFRSDELPAFVSMSNGRFMYAVIQSCGNPVKANPVPPPQPPTPTHPAVSIQKTVSKALVQLNEIFTYSVVVRNTGDLALTNLMVSDSAPAGVEFIGANGAASQQFMQIIPSLAIGASQTLTISARVVQSVAGQIVNTACVTGPQLPTSNQMCVSAQNQLECAGKPGLPINSPECQERPVPVTPTVTPTQPQPPAEVVVATKNPTLINTGVGDVFGILGGTSVVGYAAALTRRFLRMKLLGEA